MFNTPDINGEEKQDDFVQSQQINNEVIEDYFLGTIPCLVQSSLKKAKKVQKYIPPIFIEKELQKIAITKKAQVSIKLNFKHLTNEDCEYIGDAIQDAHVPLRLYLEDCKIEDEGIFHIANAIRYMRVSAEFHLSHDYLTFKAIDYLANQVKYLRPNLPITLNLERNPISSQGTKHIVSVIKNLAPGSRLNLRQTNMRDEGAKYLSQAMDGVQASHVYIDARLNNIGDQGASYIAAALPNIKGSHITLNLKGNHIGDKGIAAITNAMLKVTQMSYFTLYIGVNNIKLQGKYCIANVLKHSQTPLNIFLSDKQSQSHYTQMSLTGFVDTIVQPQNSDIIKNAKMYNMAVMPSDIVISHFSKIYNFDTSFPMIGESSLIDDTLLSLFNKDLLRLLFTFIGQDEAHRINLKIIHDKNAITNNQIYSLRHIELGLTLKEYSNDNWLTHILSGFKLFDKFIAKYVKYLISLDRKLEIDKIAQKHDIKLYNIDITMEEIWVEYAKNTHPIMYLENTVLERGIQYEKFEEGYNIYIRDDYPSLIKANHYHETLISKVNIGIKTIDIIVDATSIIIIDNNVEKFIQLSMNGALLLAMQNKNFAITSVFTAYLIDVGYKIYNNENYTEIAKTSLNIFVQSIAWSMLGLYMPTISLIAQEISTVVNAVNVFNKIYNLYNAFFDDEKMMHESMPAEYFKEDQNISKIDIIGECDNDHIFDFS